MITWSCYAWRQADLRIGLFSGSPYPKNRLDFMIAAANRIHPELPIFGWL
jgi:hypothetical protein